MTLTGLYDCTRLARELRISRNAAEAIMRRVPKEGRFVRGAHVQRMLDDHRIPHEPTTVYLARDRKGRLLYVGITGRNIRRLHAHAQAAAWWEKAASITLEHHENRRLAEAREHELIASERPQYNVAAGITPPRAAADLSDEEYRALVALEMP